MSKITQNILWALGIIFVVMLVIPLNCSTGSNGVVSDTTRVVVYDTVKIVKPIAKDSTVVRYVTKIVRVKNHIEDKLEKVADSETVSDCPGLDSDSVKVSIPITQKVYEDSTYKAYVSGFNPSLDSFMVYPRKEVQTITNKVDDKSRWSLSVSVGYGLTLTKQPTFAPMASVNLSYNIYTFPKLKKRLKNKYKQITY